MKTLIICSGVNDYGCHEKCIHKTPHTRIPTCSEQWCSLRRITVNCIPVEVNKKGDKNEN